MGGVSGTSVRVAVQSNRRLLRDALSAYLASRPDFTVVGHTADPANLFALCALRRPNVVLIEVRALTVDSVETIRELHDRFPEVAVVVVYDELSPVELDNAWRAGVSALIPHSRGLDALLVMLRHQATPGTRARAGGVGLTDREMEIISLMSSGHSVPEMAGLLGISPRTIENHKRRIYTKLDARSQSHAVARATTLGILDRPVSGGQTTPRPAVEAGRALLTVIRGVPGPSLDRVVVALLSSGLPFVRDHAFRPVAHDDWARWHRGPVMAVLVDPAPRDWHVCEELGAPVVVIHSGQPDEFILVDALLRGADAFVSADHATEHLVPVLTLVAQGYLAIEAAHARRFVEAMGARFDEQVPWLPELTARERDILRSIASGHTVRQTARSLGIAQKTVENTQARLFRKLGVRNRAGALAAAHRLGMLETDQRESG